MSRCGYVLTFALLYCCVPSLNREFRALFSGTIRRSIFAVSSASELLALFGYFLMSRALGLFYQPALVHAAEASLSQLFNLFLAFLLLRAFGVGRESAVGSPKAKVCSFVLVTAGLLACTIEDGRTAPAAVRNATIAPLWSAATGVSLVPMALGTSAPMALNTSASFYAQYPTALALPQKYGGQGYGRPWRWRVRNRRARRAKRDAFYTRGEELGWD